MAVRVSVAMAVYEGEKYLKKQLDSIVSQLKDNDELVISYDSSRDKTWEIINDYAVKDRRIKIVCDEGCGVISNFNHALKNCSGKYLFISDQDDIWLPEKIERMVEAIEATGASLIVHNGVTIDEKDTVVSDDFFSMYRIGTGFWHNFFRSRYSGCCMAFTAGFAKIVLPIPSDMDAYDRWFGLCAEKFGKIVFFDDILIHHRVHGGNVTPARSRGISTIIKTRMAMLHALTQKQKTISKYYKK